MGAGPAPLAAFKISVGCGGTTISSRELIVIHTKAKGTTGIAPFASGLDKDLVQSFALGLRLNQSGAGNHQNLNTVSNTVTVKNMGGST